MASGQPLPVDKSIGGSGVRGTVNGTAPADRSKPLPVDKSIGGSGVRGTVNGTAPADRSKPLPVDTVQRAEPWPAPSAPGCADEPFEQHLIPAVQRAEPWPAPSAPGCADEPFEQHLIPAVQRAEPGSRPPRSRLPATERPATATAPARPAARGRDRRGAGCPPRNDRLRQQRRLDQRRGVATAESRRRCCSRVALGHPVRTLLLPSRVFSARAAAAAVGLLWVILFEPYSSHPGCFQLAPPLLHTTSTAPFVDPLRPFVGDDTLVRSVCRAPRRRHRSSTRSGLLSATTPWCGRFAGHHVDGTDRPRAATSSSLAATATMTPTSGQRLASTGRAPPLRLRWPLRPP